MVALSFKSDFVTAIDAGEKRRTIRQVRKAGNPQPGKPLQLYTGMRTKACEKIKDAVCTRVRPVTISHAGIALDGRKLYAGDTPAFMGPPDPEQYDSDFARADGFSTFQDMREFFEKQYGLPFHGQLIEWR